MADSQSSALLTATAGPNSSSWLNGDDGSTSATTAGAITAPSRSPPIRTRAPAFAAAAIDSSIRCASAVEMTVPIVVSAEAGSPVRMALTLGTRASRKSPSIAG
jgi:hypothetical protein